MTFISKHLTAQLDGIARLYHYQPFRQDDPVHVERLVSVLNENKLRCSDPRNFNDRWDCRPWFDTSYIETDAVARAGLAEYIIGLEPDGSTHERLRNDPFFLEESLLRLADVYPELIYRQCAMYCLTANARSILMWTHYADNHRGICLEYGCGKSEFGVAVKVVYTDEYPLWRPHQLDEILDILLTKSNVWAYEEEYRLVIPRATVEHYPCLVDADDFMMLIPNTLKSIIVGMDGNYDAVADLARRYAPGLPVNFVTQNRSKFELALFQGKHQG